MSRLRWPDSTNSVSEKPGTIQYAEQGMDVRRISISARSRQSEDHGAVPEPKREDARGGHEEGNEVARLHRLSPEGLLGCLTRSAIFPVNRLFLSVKGGAEGQN